MVGQALQRLNVAVAPGGGQDWAKCGGEVRQPSWPTGVTLANCMNDVGVEIYFTYGEMP